MKTRSRNSEIHADILNIMENLSNISDDNIDFVPIPSQLAPLLPFYITSFHSIRTRNASESSKIMFWTFHNSAYSPKLTQ